MGAMTHGSARGKLSKLDRAARMPVSLILRLAPLLLLVASMPLAGSALAQSTEAAPAGTGDDLFRGKTVTIYIGGTPGGGLDSAGRIVARHLTKYLGGHPTVTPTMMPGAGGIRVIDFLAGTAPRDGTVMAAIPSGPLLDPLIGGRRTSYQMTDMTAVGAFFKDFSLCVSWHASPFHTLADAQAAPMSVAGTGAGSTTDTFPLVLNAAIGTHFKVITGYLGTQETALAIERGETHGRCGWSWSSLKGVKPDWLRDHKVNLLLQMGAVKSPLLPDVPFVLDLAKSDDDRRMLTLMFAPLALSNAFLAPPGLSAPRVEALRWAFMATMADPDVRRESAAQLGEEPSPTNGEDMQRTIATLYATPQPIVDRLREILKK